MLKKLRRFLNVVVLSLCSLSLLPSQQLSSLVVEEILELVTVLETNLESREIRLQNLRGRLLVSQGATQNLLNEVENLNNLNNDLSKQVKDFKIYNESMRLTIEELKKTLLNLTESNNKIEKQLVELENYYRKKILKTALISTGIGIIIGFIGGIIFYRLVVIKP